MLTQIKSEIDKLTVNREGCLISKHKPLLLVWLFYQIHNGRKSNKFTYEEVEQPLKKLLEKNRILKGDQKSTFYPFYHLGSSGLWSVNTGKLSKKEVNESNLKGKVGTLNKKYFDYLSSNPLIAYDLITYVLNQFWGVREHDKVKEILFEM